MEVAFEGHTAGVTNHVVWQTPPAYNPHRHKHECHNLQTKTLQEDQFNTNIISTMETDAGTFQHIFVSFCCWFKKL